VPFKRDKTKKRSTLDDPLHHEHPASKRIKTEGKPSAQKHNQEEDGKRDDDDEDAMLWSHFDNWDWDTIVPHWP